MKALAIAIGLALIPAAVVAQESDYQPNFVLISSGQLAEYSLDLNSISRDGYTRQYLELMNANGRYLDLRMVWGNCITKQRQILGYTLIQNGEIIWESNEPFEIENTLPSDPWRHVLDEACSR